ncbi:MAG: hypothetical protein ACNS60_14750 [Candidatus Cyclobacteriaceae bacterium M2_1C_046]
MSIIHIFGNSLKFKGIPRSIWLSIAGGASVTYIFVHLLPELGKIQEKVEFLNLDHSVYFIALGGLCFIYGLEKYAKIKSTDSPKVFWTHIFSYSIYNFTIGFLLINRPEEQGTVPLIMFFLAMGLHFFVDDHGLYHHHRTRYLHYGRWIIAGAVFLGGLTAIFTDLSEVIVDIALAFLAGGVIMNVLKEELPEERKSRYWAFILGVIGYSILIIVLTKYAHE